MINGYGLCLNEWLEDENIKTELRLLIKISSLTAERGFCYASNSFFAEYFKTSEVTISKQIKKLESLNYIEIEYERRGAEVIKRFIRLKKTLTDDYQKLKPTIKENFKENNTSNNIISIKKEKYKKENLAADNLAKRTIDFLNQTVKKSFNYTDGNLKEIKSQINKLLKTGDTLEEIENKFAHVIRVKCNEWINNQEMKKHLNPVTLFRESNFDKYLNQDMGFSASDIVDKIYEARNGK